MTDIEQLSLLWCKLWSRLEADPDNEKLRMIMRLIEEHVETLESEEAS